MPPVVVDTREQHPYAYPGAVRRTLPTGDYSLAGLEDRVSIERKSLTDCYRSLGVDRPRFRRECIRLAELEYGAIVVESDLAGVLAGDRHSSMHPHSVLHSLLSWAVELGVQVWMPGPRSVARAVTYHLLRHFWRRRCLTQRPGSTIPGRSTCNAETTIIGSSGQYSTCVP